MASNIFYSMVREYAEQIVNREPRLAFSANGRLCAILTKNHNIVSGVSALYMINETAGVIPAEYMAVVAMNNADMTRALQLITLSLADYSVVIPNPSELMIVMSMDPANAKCNVYVSPSEHLPITSLINRDQYNDVQPDELDVQNDAADGQQSNNGNAPEFAQPTASMTELFSGFGDEDSAAEGVPDSSELEKMGFITNNAPQQYQSEYKNGYSSSPQEQYSSGINLDESNPFFDNSEGSNKKSDVVYFAEIPNENDTSQKTGKNGYGGIPPQQEVLSRNELLKQAKEKKKVARANFNIRKK